MAHIQRRGPHRWRARYVDPKGREHSRTFTRKADAEKFLVSIEGSKLYGEWVDPALGKTTLGEWAAQWMKTTVHHKPRTRAGNESLLRTHILPVFGDTPLARITPVHVRDWVAERSTVLSPGRLRQAHWLLSNILKTAVEAGYIARSPCIGIRLPRIQRHEMRYLTAEEVQRLADAVDPRYTTLVLLLAYCGLRWGEACALRRGRCDMVRPRLEVRESLADVSGELHFGPTKTYQTRWVVMPPFVRARLEEEFATTPGGKDALVFTAPEGGPLRSCWRRRFWKPAVRAAGLPEELRVHDLRHTCAALLIRQQAHPKAIQAHLGHSTITVTMDLYGHLFPDDADRLAEALESAYRAATAAPGNRDGLASPPT